MTRRDRQFPLGGRQAWIVYVSALAIYILAVFNRSSLGVAGLLATERFHIAATQLSIFTMVQLFVYAAMQIPVGALLDRFGPKRLLLCGVLAMTVAQFAFAFATTFAEGVAARVFIGIGDSMVFIPLLRIVALWFPPLRIPMLSQLTGLSGQLGALMAASPLVYALHRWGWTPSYASSAAAGVLFALLVLLLVRDSPNPDHELDQIKVRAIARGVRAAWRTPGTRLGLWSHFSAQFGATVFALLWGYPFLVAGQGLSPSTAGTLLMLMTVTTVITSPVIGGFITKYPFSRSTLILGIVVAIMTVWGVVLLWPGRAPLPLLVVLVLVTAVGGPGSLVGFDLARTFNPPTRLGSATGIVNVGGFLASLSTVTLIGFILDRVAPGGPTTYTVDSFRVAMSAQYLVWTLGVVQILRYRHKARRGLQESDPEAYAALRAGQSIVP
ncbi:nitrate/nitrite transporter [Nostocoides sp. HKS02]|uniref:MFS transporter n=1 Tax=Nostocoides sp. HKS02 TaxID=1813880 RepID=UPI001E47BE5D|nr:MFS transporter [Tetrasphaera sp. HKS02]